MAKQNYLFTKENEEQWYFRRKAVPRQRIRRKSPNLAGIIRLIFIILIGVIASILCLIENLFKTVFKLIGILFLPIRSLKKLI